jgi:SAM-dependent methyltransferase
VRFGIPLARFLIRLGKFVRSLAVVAMNPDELIEFSRRAYAGEQSLRYWTGDEMIARGLLPHEKALLDRVPIEPGRLLLLGLGGGREALPLARAGWDVTGVEYVPRLAESAARRAEAEALALHTLVQDVESFDLPGASFDLACLFAAMYSSVPTRARRVALLRRVHHALRPGGFFALEFHLNPNVRTTPAGDLIRRAFAVLVFGNVRYEPGDVLWGDGEFIHVFRALEEIRPEFRAAGFDVVSIHTRPDDRRAEALLRKPEPSHP